MSVVWRGGVQRSGELRHTELPAGVVRRLAYWGDPVERVRGGVLRACPVLLGGPREAPVEGRTSGGDVELENVQAPIIARTSGGNMDVEVTLKDFSKPHGVELRTSGGDITLTLPAGIPVTVVAEIVLDKRRRSMKRYDIYSDFPLSKKQTEEEGKDVIRSTGEVNGGGDKVYLRTSAGNIHIKKR